MKRSTRRLLKRALALILAFAIVISFGLYNSMDRVLQAEALPDDSAIEVVDEYEDFEEEEPEEEVVEVQLAERDEEDEAEADEADEIVEAEAVEDEEEEEETTTIAAEDADEDFADEETEDDGASDASEQKDTDRSESAGGSGSGSGSGSSRADEDDTVISDAGSDVSDDETETEEEYYEDDGFVEFSASVPLDNERIIIEVKGERATVSFTGEMQEVEGFTYEAHGAKTKVDVTDDIIFELEEDEEARAEGVQPGIYYMDLKEEMFHAESDDFDDLKIEILEDGYLKITGECAETESYEAIEESSAAEEETSAAIEETEEETSAAEEETSAAEEETEESAEAETDEFGNPIEPETDEFGNLIEAETEELPPEILMPAQTFGGSAGGLRVSVTAPEGAFPEGTVMRVTPVYDLEDTIADGLGLGEGEFVKSVKAVDITFYFEDEEIEPLVPIQVSLRTNAISEESKIVHLDDTGAVTEVDAAIDTAANINNATFDTESFSIYAVVETGEDARLKVVFVNGDDELASVY